MEWFEAAVAWFERNAVIIAALEFAVLFIFAPGKMLFGWLRHRWLKREMQRQMEQLRQSETNFERRHQELTDIRSITSRIEMKSLGDSGRFGRLPDGTHIVETCAGRAFLATPVDVVLGAVSVPSPTATLSVEVVDKDDG